MLGDSNGNPWNGAFIVANGNLLAGFRTNAAYESQGRLQTARLYNMSDDPGVMDGLTFNLARDTMHQLQWLRACEELEADGLADTVVPDVLLDGEYREHAGTLWHLSDGPDSEQGGWAHRVAPDGKHEFSLLADPQPLGGKDGAPKPGPALYATYSSEGLIAKVKAAIEG